MPLGEVFEVSTDRHRGAVLVPYSAALDLPHALVEWVTMLILIRERSPDGLEARASGRVDQRTIVAKELKHPKRHLRD